MPNVKLITFGGGGISYRQAAERLIKQSWDFPSITSRKLYTDTDLDSEYYETFKEVKDYQTGFGFYSWKPYIIFRELMALEPNDILIYLDAGCELNNEGIRRFDDYLSYTSKKDVLLFEIQLQNRYWTKNHPMLLGYPEHFFRNQIASGIIFLKNNGKSQQLIKSWLDLCAFEKGVLLADPEESSSQLPGFVKHRHDQSCLSICAYQQNVESIPDETFYLDWRDGRNYPILAFRNRTGNSVLQQRLRRNILYKIKVALSILMK